VLHAEEEARLPAGVELGYDGMLLEAWPRQGYQG
jgi:hypothetical protein